MKKIIITVSVLALVCAGWFFARPAYRHFRETQAAKRACTFFVKRDYRSASLSARQALARNPKNPQACRVMADLAEIARSPTAIDWHRRICEADPGISNKLCLAGAALRFQRAPCPIASQVLSEIAPAAGHVPEFHVLSAQLALKSGDLAGAAAEFQKALQLEPGNDLHRLNLAVLQLQSTNPATASLGKTTLETLQASTNVGAVALRWLVADSVTRSNLAVAQTLSAKLLKNPRASLSDRLQHLTILQQQQDPAFAPMLTQLQNSAATNSPSASLLASWMLDHGMHPLAWLTNCPTILHEQPVRLALIDCYTATSDWAGLESFLQQQPWAELEFLRMAFLSLAASSQTQPLLAETRWRTAVREAGESLASLTRLIELSAAWGREKATEDLLWHIDHRFPRERWPLRELDRLYSRTGNTRGLNKLYSAIAGRDPGDFVAKNNVAATCLLLKLGLPRAHELARELHAQRPGNAVITSTYAYSLHLQGHTVEGIAALEALKPEELFNPSIALYYGCLQAAAGETNKAAKYLDAARGAVLLPEEQALLSAAALNLR